MNTTAAPRPARARLRAWPYDPDVAHLVLLDHQMVPTATDLARWTAEAEHRGAHTIRTGALFPDAAAPFHSHGYAAIESLALLRRGLDGTTPRALNAAPRWSTRRLAPGQLADVAELDRRCFGDTWANDAAGLAEIGEATPSHRARAVHRGGAIVAFAISGRAGRTGYVQRLAVAPEARRLGLARLLVSDALAWARRRGAREMLVNTATDNDAALALYASLGFTRLTVDLTILERRLR